MVHVRLFRRYYFATALIVLVFIFLGFVTARLVTRYTTNPPEPHPPVFYAKLIDHLHPDQRDQALAEVISWNTGGTPYQFALVDQGGTVLYPPGETLPFAWNDVEKPKEEYSYKNIPEPQNGNGHSMHALIRFSGEPAQYLFVSFGHRGGRPQTVFFWTFASLVISVLMGIAFSMVLLFRSLRVRAQQADYVLNQLQSGNLKARFRVSRMDELGAAMSRFNRMADEIERLVERLKSVEKSRMTLLQELAHDLRTPVASLKNMLETMLSRGETVDPKIREELLSLSVREAEYFERLVEDLLVLAQLTEPRYRAGADRVAFDQLVEEEAESVAAHAAAGRERPAALQKAIAPDLPEIYGDPHLLRRMIRNALLNAFSYAKTAVTVRLDGDGDHELRLEVLDDGDGFTPEALATFGERRISRVLDPRHPDRLSVGLGSVILRTVAELHRGRVEARNAPEGGASVVITVPISPGS